MKNTSPPPHFAGHHHGHSNDHRHDGDLVRPAHFEQPSPGSVIEFFTELMRTLSHTVCNMSTYKVGRLTNGVNVIAMVIRRIGEGKSLVPDHGKTDTTLCVEPDPRHEDRPEPTLIDGIEFFVSVRLDYESIGGGHVHVFPTVSIKGSRQTSQTEMRFERSLKIDTDRVYVSLEELLPFGQMHSFFPNKVDAICATHIARRFVLCVSGGSRTYSFRLAHKNDETVSTETVSVPIEVIKAVRD